MDDYRSWMQSSWLWAESLVARPVAALHSKCRSTHRKVSLLIVDVSPAVLAMRGISFRQAFRAAASARELQQVSCLDAAAR